MNNLTLTNMEEKESKILVAFFKEQPLKIRRLIYKWLEIKAKEETDKAYKKGWEESAKFINEKCLD